MGHIMFSGTNEKSKCNAHIDDRLEQVTVGCEQSLRRWKLTWSGTFFKLAISTAFHREY